MCIWTACSCINPNGSICLNGYRVLASSSESLVFGYNCWPSVEMSDKLLIPYFLPPPSRQFNG